MKKRAMMLLRKAAVGHGLPPARDQVFGSLSQRGVKGVVLTRRLIYEHAVGVNTVFIGNACRGTAYRKRHQRVLGVINEPVMDGVESKFQAVGNAQLVKDVV
jgi:hypothetical protein